MTIHGRALVDAFTGPVVLEVTVHRLVRNIQAGHVHLVGPIHMALYTTGRIPQVTCVECKASLIPKSDSQGQK